MYSSFKFDAYSIQLKPLMNTHDNMLMLFQVSYSKQEQFLNKLHNRPDLAPCWVLDKSSSRKFGRIESNL